MVTGRKGYGYGGARLFSAVAGAGAITVLLLLRMSRLWRLVFGLACPSAHGQKSQFSRLIRPLALGKADFACARGHRLRRLVEVRRQAKRQAMYVVVSRGSKAATQDMGRNTAAAAGIQGKQASTGNFEEQQLSA